jgi:hypothetical protein
MTTQRAVTTPPYDWEQEREHAVNCRICCRCETWSPSAICPACAADPDDFGGAA